MAGATLMNMSTSAAITITERNQMSEEENMILEFNRELCKQLSQHIGSMCGRMIALGVPHRMMAKVMVDAAISLLASHHHQSADIAASARDDMVEAINSSLASREMVLMCDIIRQHSQNEKG